MMVNLENYGPFLTVPQVAEIFGISKVHAYQLAASGIIPKVNMGKSVRISKEWVECKIAEARGDSENEATVSVG